jgi:hypothetical protein
MSQINCIFQTLEKKLFATSFQKPYDSVRQKVLYNILIVFGITMKLGGLIMWLNETYSDFWIGEHLRDTFQLCFVLPGPCSLHLQLNFVSISKHPLLKEVYL